MTDAKKPKVGKDTIYIDAEDDITNIISKVKAAKEKVVALVLPKRSTVLQSIVNMRLLKRISESADKKVVLITSETALTPLAGAAGLHIAKNLHSKPVIPPSPVDSEPQAKADADDEIDADDEVKSDKLDYHRSIGELAAVAAVSDDTETIPLDDEADNTEAPKAATASNKNKKLKVPNFDRFRLLLGLGALALVVLIVSLILATKVLPKSKVTITTTSTPVSANINLTASDKIKTLDITKKEIPATLKTSDQTSTQTVQATGQQNNGQKAQGQIVLSIPCAAVSGTPPTIPAGTGVSSSGLTFLTQKSAKLDKPDFSGGCKFTDSTDVTAQQPGAKYNIGPSSFSVAGFSNVSASSSKPMTGGTDEVVTVISQQDVDKAKAKISSQSSDDFSKNFQKDLDSKGFYVLTSTLKIGDAQVTVSPDVGQAASSANASIKITYSALVISKDDFKKVLADAADKEIDKSKQKINGDLLTKATVTVSSQPSPSSADLEISEDITAIPIINEQEIKQLIIGKKTSTIRDAISKWPGVKDVDVKMSPFWVSKAPKKTSKITIVVKEAPGDKN